jgi:hypothetical protein
MTAQSRKAADPIALEPTESIAAAPSLALSHTSAPIPATAIQTATHKVLRPFSLGGFGDLTVGELPKEAIEVLEPEQLAALIDAKYLETIEAA